MDESTEWGDVCGRPRKGRGGSKQKRAGTGEAAVPTEENNEG